MSCAQKGPDNLELRSWVGESPQSWARERMRKASESVRVGAFTGPRPRPGPFGIRVPRWALALRAQADVGLAAAGLGGNTK